MGGGTCSVWWVAGETRTPLSPTTQEGRVALAPRCYSAHHNPRSPLFRERRCPPPPLPLGLFCVLPVPWFFLFSSKRGSALQVAPHPPPPPTHPHLSRKAQESEPNALPVVVRCHGGACHHHHHTAHCLSCFFLAPLSLVVGQHMPGLGKAMATGRPRTRHGSVPLCTLPAAAVSHTATVTGARGNARCTEPWLAVGPLGAVVVLL